jgi:cytochrome b subunit of formate dehydrogenase
VDVYQKIRHDLGLSKIKPHFNRYSYIEKAEYWALMWGSGVMIMTGIMLVFENWAMTHFPKWAIDVANAIHFYEAVLATLAIVVWHFYFTIFDPDHYPMNWSMTTGRAKEEEKKEEEKKEEAKEKNEGQAPE